MVRIAKLWFEFVITGKSENIEKMSTLRSWTHKLWYLQSSRSLKDSNDKVRGIPWGGNQMLAQHMLLTKNDKIRKSNSFQLRGLVWRALYWTTKIWLVWSKTIRIQLVAFVPYWSYNNEMRSWFFKMYNPELAT